jgi:hypothetical protein
MEGLTNDDLVQGEVGNVFLLQIDKTSDADVAYEIMEDISKDDLYAVTVFSNNNYYIFGGIATSEAALADKKAAFEDKSYTTVFVKQYLLDKPNSVIDESLKFEFWSECVDNLFRSLNDDPIVISEKFNADPVNVDIYVNFLTLKSVTNEKLKQKYLLNSYEIICEILG